MNKTLLAVYYNDNIRNMLNEKLTLEDKDYIKENNENLENILYTRWKTIVNSLPEHYYTQYLSPFTEEERNDWFQRYLDYPSKDISLMPEWL